LVKTKGMLRDVKLNQKTFASRMSKGSICNISGTVKGIKLKLSGDVGLYQKKLCISKGGICNASVKAEGIWLKLKEC
jgi:hypothetical protein